MEGPYADHILDASDTCSNCHRLTHTDRVDRYMRDQQGGGTFADVHQTPRRQATTRDHVPFDPPTDDEVVFCACGVETQHDRVWDTLTREHFDRLLQELCRTVERKGVTLKRKTLFMVALSQFKEAAEAGTITQAEATETFATALETAIITQAHTGSKAKA